MTDVVNANTGRSARSPFEMPKAGWKAVLIRTWRESGDDNVGLLAAGVAFYGFLAMVPLLGAIVLSYGLIASPAIVMEHIRSLTDVMPADAARLVGEQLLNVVTASEGKKGFGLLLALALALYGATKGAGAVVTALNVAYEQREERGFVHVTLVTLAITIAAVGLAIVAMIAIAALGHLDALLPGAPGVVLVLGKLLSYLLLAAGGAAAAATLYRFAPDRAAARWVWLTPGSLAVTLLWLALTLGFGTYVANFGSYDATYGSLGAVVVLLTWLYLSAYILIMGAELNAELEHQTAIDTTGGVAVPMGMRGATAADTIAPRTNDVSLPTPGEGKAGSRLATIATLTSLPALMTTAGLGLVRRRRGGAGVAIIVVATALAWSQRRDEGDQTP